MSNRRRKTRDDEKDESLAKALDALDEVHAHLIAFAEDQEIEHTAADRLTADDGDDYPETDFWVGGTAKRVQPVRGEVALQTRLCLKLDDEQAEALLFEIARAVREGQGGSADLEIQLDGRVIFDESSADDLRKVLR